jgi:cellulose 1,4-beta-cellobiosidase
MRRTSHLFLSTTSLVALLSALGCSSDGGSDRDATPFVPPGGGAGTGGATSTTPGAVGGSTGGPVGSAGSTAEGQGGTSLNAGTGGTAMAIGGAGGTAAVTDVIAEPGPGFFTSGAWKGYAWTAIESDPVVGATTRTPTDYTTLADGAPYCLTGTVAADPPSSMTATDGYQGFAMLGFNINQAGIPEVEGTEPTIATAVPTGAGIAFTFSQTVASELRVQIQGIDPTIATQRWCAAVPLPDAQGRAFIPYTEFHQTCYDPASLVSNTAGFYDTGTGAARAPIAAVSFQVPGNTTPIPYNFCVAGFADAADITGAPAEISGGGLPSGTIATKFGRFRVRGTDGKSYIVQNNAWNEASGQGAQVLQFTGNSLQITSQTAGGAGDVPLGFPSIYVGRNGFRGTNDSLTTTADDNLPIQVSAINSIQTRFAHNASGDANATYDVWFAAQPPAGEYQTATGAFLMVWTYKPGNRNAIGGFGGGGAQTATVDGRQWNLFVGGRAEAGDPGAGNAQVISYVVPGAAISDYSFDLNLFIEDAVQRGLLSPTMFLTDVFAGFEIWSGGSGLRIDDFTVDVQ